MNILRCFIASLILSALRVLHLLNTLRFMILQQNCKPKPRLDTQYLGLQDHFSSKG